MLSNWVGVSKFQRDLFHGSSGFPWTFYICFIWRLDMNRIEVAWWRGVNTLDMACALCSIEQEDSSHLFYQMTNGKEAHAFGASLILTGWTLTLLIHILDIKGFVDLARGRNLKSLVAKVVRLWCCKQNKDDLRRKLVIWIFNMVIEHPYFSISPYVT